MNSYDAQRLHRVLGPDLVGALTDAQRSEVDADVAADEEGVARLARGLHRADIAAPAAVLLHRLRRRREAQAQARAQRPTSAPDERWDEPCSDPATPSECERWLAIQRASAALAPDAPLRRMIALHAGPDRTLAPGTGRTLLRMLEAQL